MSASRQQRPFLARVGFLTQSGHSCRATKPLPERKRRLRVLACFFNAISGFTSRTGIRCGRMTRAKSRSSNGPWIAREGAAGPRLDTTLFRA